MSLQLIQQHSFTCNNTVSRICSCLHAFKGNRLPEIPNLIPPAVFSQPNLSTLLHYMCKKL